MTEFEAASLAVQQTALTLQKDTLKLQQVSLALQQASLAVQRASVWVAVLVGAAQCSLIAYGLYIMRQASRQRDAQNRENMEAIKVQNESLRELIRRTSVSSAPQDG